ncbi:MAG TPA: glycoside hydrolase family 2 TIM barrel-domain containing protein [Negativicutes bacterium]|nr:glycoside hydrolase family 2 TIM barrel-domain containing protein [Negativicutes bacterium]
MKKIINVLLVIIAVASLAACIFFVSFKAPVQENITWGVDFSQMQAEAMKLDWKETYLAILEDLGVKHIKLHTQWDWVEGKKDEFYFKDIDWQIKETKKRGADMIYVLGMKTGRWPECHIPAWAEGLSKEEQQSELLEYIEKIVLRYKDSGVIVAWQAENEPFFVFGECPWYDKEFLKKEVALIKKLDPSRPVIISDSGEQSLWFGAARLGDVVGTTMYRKVWVHLAKDIGFYFTFPLPPASYWVKAQLVEALFGKKVIGVELQAEPWNSKVFYNVPLAEQEKSMNIAQFNKNIAYAKQSGLDTFYFWGVEWWYWLKEKHDKPEIWNEAKKLFIQ